MKKRNWFILWVLLLGTSWLNIDNQIFGQEKVTISTGIGLPEGLNIGIQLRLHQTEIGGSIGCLGAYGTIPLSAGIYYHFCGSSKFSEIRPWYGRASLDYLFLGNNQFDFECLLYNIRIGRDLNVANKIGIEIDAGACYSPIKLLFDSYFTPSFGIRLFYKII